MLAKNVCAYIEKEINGLKLYVFLINQLPKIINNAVN